MIVMIRNKQQILGITLVCYHTKKLMSGLSTMNRPNEGNPFVFFVQLIISTEERINRVVILYTKQRIQGFTMQSDLIKSTPVYRLLKGFSVMKYIRNILVIHLHSLLFINSFFYNRVGIAEKDEREEPKGIVFLCKLLLLF